MLNPSMPDLFTILLIYSIICIDGITPTFHTMFLNFAARSSMNSIHSFSVYVPRACYMLRLEQKPETKCSHHIHRVYKQT